LKTPLKLLALFWQLLSLFSRVLAVFEHYSAKTPPKLLKNFSIYSRKLLENSSKTPRKLLENSSETPPKLLKTSPKLLEISGYSAIYARSEQEQAEDPLPAPSTTRAGRSLQWGAGRQCRPPIRPKEPKIGQNTQL
jgi:hypothetical protein